MERARRRSSARSRAFATTDFGPVSNLLSTLPGLVGPPVHGTSQLVAIAGDRAATVTITRLLKGVGQLLMDTAELIDQQTLADAKEDLKKAKEGLSGDLDKLKKTVDGSSLSPDDKKKASAAIDAAKADLDEHLDKAGDSLIKERDRLKAAGVPPSVLDAFGIDQTWLLLIRIKENWTWITVSVEPETDNAGATTKCKIVVTPIVGDKKTINMDPAKCDKVKALIARLKKAADACTYPTRDDAEEFYKLTA